jgi:hypothetical protein
MIEGFYKDNPQNKKLQGEFKKKPKKREKLHMKQPARKSD